MPYGATGGCSRCREPPLTVFCEIELRKLSSRLCFEPFLLLERFQKRQNEKCNKILEPGGGEAFLELWDVEKVVKKNMPKFDKKTWELEGSWI